MPCALSPQEIEHYHEHGFVIAREVFDTEEISLLGRAMAEDPLVQSHRLERADADGGSTGISLWNRAGDSVYGLVWWILPRHCSAVMSITFNPS